MPVRRKPGILLNGTVIGACFLLAAPAFANEADLQRQINAMQRQLKSLQDQLNRNKQQQAKQAGAADQPAQKNHQAAQSTQHAHDQTMGADTAIPPAGTLFTRAFPSPFDSIHTSMGGTFVALKAHGMSITKSPAVPAVLLSAARAFRCITQLCSTRMSFV
jgi:hypothetical protein